MHFSGDAENLDDEYFEEVAFGDEDGLGDGRVEREPRRNLQDTEAEDILKSIGIYKERGKSSEFTEAAPADRFWLHDTPGAINDAQVQHTREVVVFFDLIAFVFLI